MYARNGVDVRVARVFATIGSRLASAQPPYYGPVRTSSYVDRVIQLALRNETIDIYSNDAHVLVSLQFVDDVVTGLMRLMRSNYSLPVNLANPNFYTLEVKWSFFMQLFLKLARCSFSKLLSLAEVHRRFDTHVPLRKVLMVRGYIPLFRDCCAQCCLTLSRQIE